VRIIIAGAGALGSVLGGYLAEAGASVTLLARKAHAEAIEANGLLIEGIRGTRRIQNVRAVSAPEALEAADLLLLAVKSYDTDATLAGIGHLHGKIGGALSVQNGGGKDEALAKAFGPPAVIGATCIVGGAVTAPGRVVHTFDGATWIGEPDGHPSDRVEALAALFCKAELPIEVRADIQSATWCKLNQMVPAAALSCLTRLPLHRIYLDPGLATLFVELSREMAPIAARLNIPLGDFQGFPVHTLCTQPFEAAVESVRARGRLMQERGMTQVKISTLQDLERGRRTEADQTIGYTVRLAARFGIAVPKLEALAQVIRGIELTQLAAGTVSSTFTSAQ
jgi:2-dehydropantoate 2-reductase